MNIDPKKLDAQAREAVNTPQTTRARVTAAPQEGVSVPPGYTQLPQPITEEMHVAAVKVLHRAHGVDGLPQRMLDAMVAAAPQPLSPPATGNVGATWSCSRCGAKSVQACNENGCFLGENGPQPVAWIVHTKEVDLLVDYPAERYDSKNPRTPLYAALPPPGRGMVPMTTAEIDLAVRNAQIAFALDKFKTFEEALVRKAEAHHGIKEGS